MLETLDHTIRIGSTPTFLYFDMIYTALSLYIEHLARIEEQLSNIVPIGEQNNVRIKIDSTQLEGNFCDTCNLDVI